MSSETRKTKERTTIMKVGGGEDLRRLGGWVVQVFALGLRSRTPQGPLLGWISDRYSGLVMSASRYVSHVQYRSMLKVDAGPNGVCIVSKDK
jgi:hypothetical protein